MIAQLKTETLEFLSQCWEFHGVKQGWHSYQRMEEKELGGLRSREAF